MWILRGCSLYYIFTVHTVNILLFTFLYYLSCSKESTFSQNLKSLNWFKTQAIIYKSSLLQICFLTNKVRFRLSSYLFEIMHGRWAWRKPREARSPHRMSFSVGLGFLSFVLVWCGWPVTLFCWRFCLIYLNCRSQCFSLDLPFFYL